MVAALTPAEARPAGEPQAGAAGDAAAEADPAPPPARAAQAARLLRVERPRQLWQLDMTSIWVAEHGWTYLNAIDRLLHPRDRRLGAEPALPRRRSDRRRRPGRQGLRDPARRARRSAPTTARRSPPAASANDSPSSGSATAAAATATPSARPSSRAGSGNSKNGRSGCNEYETLDDARRGIAGYVDRYHHRPHSGLNYRTPAEVAPDLGGSTGTTKTSGLTCRTPTGSRQLDATKVRKASDFASDIATVCDALGVERFCVGNLGRRPARARRSRAAAGSGDRRRSLASVAPYDAEGLEFPEGMRDQETWRSSASSLKARTCHEPRPRGSIARSCSRRRPAAGRVIARRCLGRLIARWRPGSRGLPSRPHARGIGWSGDSHSMTNDLALSRRAD